MHVLTTSTPLRDHRASRIGVTEQFAGATRTGTGPTLDDLALSRSPSIAPRVNASTVGVHQRRDTAASAARSTRRLPTAAWVLACVRPACTSASNAYASARLVAARRHGPVSNSVVDDRLRAPFRSAHRDSGRAARTRGSGRLRASVYGPQARGRAWIAPMRRVRDPDRAAAVRPQALLAQLGGTFVLRRQRRPAESSADGSAAAAPARSPRPASVRRPGRADRRTHLRIDRQALRRTLRSTNRPRTPAWSGAVGPDRRCRDEVHRRERRAGRASMRPARARRVPEQRARVARNEPCRARCERLVSTAPARRPTRASPTVSNPSGSGHAQVASRTRHAPAMFTTTQDRAIGSRPLVDSVDEQVRQLRALRTVRVRCARSSPLPRC